MKEHTGFRSCLAAFRPWPYGPPLRGRAPRDEAGARVVVRGQLTRARHNPISHTRSGRQALAPVGGLACIRCMS